MILELPPALETFVKDLVAQGRYADEADVVRDALRRLAERDLDPETGLAISVLRTELAQAEAGSRSSATVMEIFERAAASARSAAE